MQHVVHGSTILGSADNVDLTSHYASKLVRHRRSQQFKLLTLQLISSGRVNSN